MRIERVRDIPTILHVYTVFFGRGLHPWDHTTDHIRTKFGFIVAPMMYRIWREMIWHVCEQYWTACKANQHTHESYIHQHAHHHHQQQQLSIVLKTTHILSCPFPLGRLGFNSNGRHRTSKSNCG